MSLSFLLENGMSSKEIKHLQEQGITTAEIAAAARRLVDSGRPLTEPQEVLPDFFDDKGHFLHNILGDPIHRGLPPHAGEGERMNAKKKTSTREATRAEAAEMAAYGRAAISNSHHTTAAAGRQIKIVDFLLAGVENAVPRRHLR